MSVREYTMGSGFNASQFNDECVALDAGLTMCKTMESDPTPRGSMLYPKAGTSDKLVITSIGGDFTGDEGDDLDTAAAAHVAATTPGSAPAHYGDGSDNDVTYTDNTTLTGNVYADNVTINAGVDVRSGGYFLFVRDTLNLVDASSRFHDDGNDAVADVGGAALTVSGFRVASIAGATGRSTLGTGSGTASYNGRRDNTQAPLARGGAGGAGGGQAGGARASGSTWTAPNVNVDSVQSLPFILGGGSMRRINDTTMQKWATGNGGAAGGCDPGSGTATSGGGGGGGGAVHLIARNIIGLGTISANAGNGGNAAQTGDGDAGGGGAGGPGRVCVICEKKAAGVTIEAAIGTGGTGAGGGGVNGGNSETTGLVSLIVEG